MKNVPFCSPIISRKSHQSVSLNSERFRNGIEKIGLGGNFTPPPLGQGRVNIVDSPQLSVQLNTQRTDVCSGYWPSLAVSCLPAAD